MEEIMFYWFKKKEGQVLKKKQKQKGSIPCFEPVCFTHLSGLINMWGSVHTLHS